MWFWAWLQDLFRLRAKASLPQGYAAELEADEDDDEDDEDDDEAPEAQ